MHIFLIAQRLVRPREQLKQVIQIEHIIVNSSPWAEPNQLAIYKCRPRI